MGAAAMDARVNCSVRTRKTPDEGANVEQKIVMTLKCKTDWSKDEEASSMR